MTFGRRYLSLDDQRQGALPSKWKRCSYNMDHYDQTIPAELSDTTMTHGSISSPGGPSDLLFWQVIAEDLLTTSTSLESTLILAYGRDLFLTRVSPSRAFDTPNPNFNRIQLALTVGGLAAAILLARPLVRSRNLKRCWQY